MLQKKMRFRTNFWFLASKMCEIAVSYFVILFSGYKKTGSPHKQRSPGTFRQTEKEGFEGLEYNPHTLKPAQKGESTGIVTPFVTQSVTLNWFI